MKKIAILTGQKYFLNIESFLFCKYRRNLPVFTHHFSNESFLTYDVVVCINYDQIIKGNDEFWKNETRAKIINIHTGLPQYPGSNPWFWSVLEGKENGVTVHEINSNKVDCGGILWWQELDDYDREHLTGSQLRERLFELAKENLVAIVDMAENDNLPSASTEIKWNGAKRKVSDMKAMFCLDEDALNSDVFRLLMAASSDDHNNCFFLSDDGEKFWVNLQIKRE